jgi:pyruvate/2-oxoglutarate/acetoin dehydrogenase E1 component
MITVDMTMAEALNQALIEEMERDDSVFVVGEDIGASGGLFQVTANCLDKFGRDRVVDSPISEAAIAGLAVGAAIVGSRPVIEVQISDFMTLMMDALVNHAAKYRYMSGGQVSVPAVFRGPISNGIGMAAQHSQSLESWFVHTPGLIVVMPSNAADAKGLLKSAIRDNNPVVFLEKRMLYSRKAPVPQGDYLVPLGSADVKREGRDVSVVTAGYGVSISLQAARLLAREGIEVEVVDVRTLKPLDMDTIGTSVAKTGRLVAVSEGARAGSFASEVVARVVDQQFSDLKAKPERVTALDVPIPCAASLERVVLPSADDVVAAVKRSMG